MTKAKMTIDARLARVEKALGLNEKQTTRALIIQDKSGSMLSRLQETIDGYNEYIGSLKADDSDELYITLVQFDEDYEVVEKNVPIKDATLLDNESYRIGGWTALYDAVGTGVTTLKEEMEAGDRALVVIMTDGKENSSKEYDQTAIAKLIKECEAEGNFTFVFLGAGRDSWGNASRMGITREKAVFYSGTPQAQSAAFKSMVGTTASYRSSSNLAEDAFGAAVTMDMSEKGAEVETEGTKPTPLWTPGDDKPVTGRTANWEADDDGDES